MSKDFGEESNINSMKKAFQEKVYRELCKSESIPDVSVIEPSFEKNQDILMSSLQSLASKCFFFCYSLFF